LVQGIVRNTIDIGFLILEETLEEAKIAAAAAGFDFDSGFIADADAPRVFRLLKIEAADYIILDLMLVDEKLREIWTDRIASRFGKTTIKVVSKASLLRMKSQSKRLKDLMDVESFNALNGGGA
jgi:hypothetical protein